METYKPQLKDYKRTMKPLRQYSIQLRDFMKIKYNLNDDEIKSIFEEAKLRSGFKIPGITYNHRDYRGDMIEDKSNLLNYLNEIDTKGYVSAPSLTSYTSHKEVIALPGQFLNVNAKNRAVFKKKKFIAILEKDPGGEVLYHNRQAAMKVYNNTKSGMQGSRTTIFYNPTGHSSLTSTTRCVSGIGNYMSESIVGGNRYYKDFDTTYEYIVACSTSCDMKKIERARKKYNITTPTPAFIFQRTLETTQYYWHHEEKEQEILNYLEQLDENQLCAVAFNCDLYSLRLVNEELVRTMLDELSTRQPDTPYDNYEEDVELFHQDVDIEILTKYLCAPLLVGVNVDFKKMKEENNTTLYAITRTARHVYNTLLKYKDLYDAFFFTQVLPPNLGYIKNMMRKSIVISDTDSTCCAYDEWVLWFSGNLKHTDKNACVSSAVMSLTSIFISHGLKILSKNINTSDENMERLQMKNEFYWATFVVANITKHYFALVTISEGTVYPEPRREVKGVNLLASNSPINIRTTITKMIDDINNTLRERGNIDLKKYVDIVMGLEQDMLKDYQNGETYMFVKETVKHHASYSLDPLKSKYRDYLMWHEVFENKYGSIGTPPYVAYKLPVKPSVGLPGIKDAIMKSDKVMGDKFVSWMLETQIKEMKTIRIPKLIADKKGIPTEIFDCIDVKKAICLACHGLYIILSALGYNKKPGVLISDVVNGTLAVADIIENKESEDEGVSS